MKPDQILQWQLKTLWHQTDLSTIIGSKIYEMQNRNAQCVGSAHKIYYYMY
jgi:hypothetical protein